MIHHNQLTTIFGKEQKAEDNILSLFDTEKYVLKSHNELTSRVMVQVYISYTGCCPEDFDSSPVN